MYVHERVSEYFTKVFGHSVGNKDINREGLTALCIADELNQRYPDTDMAGRYLAEHAIPIQGKVVRRFVGKVEKALRWQLKDPYWKHHAVEEKAVLKIAKEYIQQKAYGRAYSSLCGMYGRYRERVPYAPRSVRVGIIVRLACRDTLVRHRCNSRVLSKKRF